VEHAGEALRPHRQLPEALHAVLAAGARGDGPGAAGVQCSRHRLLASAEGHQKGLEVVNGNLRHHRPLIYLLLAHQVDLASSTPRMCV